MNHKLEQQMRESHVFVVHGRDTALRNAMFAFLRSIALWPIEWNQAIRLTGKASPYLGEILDAAFSNAQAVVVLLSGDDLAALRPELRKSSDPEYETRYTPQARPNVLFEAGMALATHQDRTVLVQVGHIRPFSDIAGRHILVLDNSSARRQQIADRLRIAGCPVDISGIDWHTSGNFSVDQERQRPDESERVLSSNEGARTLNENAHKVLAVFARSSKDIAAKYIPVYAQLHPQVAQHCLGKLAETGYIRRPYRGNDYFYQLTSRGIEFIVANELL